MLKLYSYFRSSAAYRVRIALNLKGLPYTTIPVHLLKDGGQQHSAEYRALNPQGLVPLLADGIENIQQSLAIIEYLEEIHPAPALLPSNALDRAWVRGLALSIAADIHPLNNTRVLKYLKRDLGVSDAQKDAWYAHWIQLGFAALEKTLSNDKRVGRCCYGDTPGLADTCLVPQVTNAYRFNVDISAFPTILRLYNHCMTLPAFQQAAPQAQPDAE